MKRLSTLLLLYSSLLIAQDFSGIKIYVNPGHGGNDPANDRYIPETGFWESEGNLTKGLYIRDLLIKHGAQVIMSRVTNFEADDRSLSGIAAEANANNADFFHSIHSNATGTTTKANYTLLLFRGYDNQPVFPAAKTMSQIMVQEITAANRTIPLSNTVRGDWSFYTNWGDKVGLGVLRTLAMPGVLSEGSFHDYIPEAFRLTNLAYRKHEAVSFLRSWIRFFQKSPLPHGTVAGIVRDPIKNIDYTWLSVLPDDEKAPVNNLIVRLEPGGRLYHGDQKNNGFFFFDSVAAGTYKVHISAPGYAPDSADIIVQANKVNFRDFYAINTAPPHIASYSPADPSDSVRISTGVSIRFTNTMNTAKTEQAFHITPPVEGTFAWQDYDQVMIFTARYHFDPATTYRVTIDTNAVNKLDATIDSTFSFEFVTDRIGRFELESSYPDFAQNSGLSTTLQVRLYFNQPVATASVSGNLYVEDSAGERQPLVRAKVMQEGGKGRILFELKNQLEIGKTYRIIISEQVRSTYNIRLTETLVIPFTTVANPVRLSTVIDPCDAINNWISPVMHPLSSGLDLAGSKISSVSDRIVSKNNAIKLTYSFPSDSGQAAFFRKQPVPLNSGATGTKIGIWVFGDLSGNHLSFCFASDSDSLIKQSPDAILYTGWRFYHININELPYSPTLFLGMMLEKSPLGSHAGELGFDDLCSGELTGIQTQPPFTLPTQAALYQNYPNPFNPATTIHFSLAREETIELTVYNLSGEIIRTLMHQQKLQPGVHTCLWDGTDAAGGAVPSGVYFYRLNGNTLRQSKKMTLVK